MKFTIRKGNITGHLVFGQIQISSNNTLGYRPFELFISSIAGCSGALLEKILIKKRHPFESIQLEVSYVRNPDHSNRFEEISIIAYVQSQKIISQVQADKLAALVVKNCGMIQSIIETIDVTFFIQYVSLDGEKP